MGERQSRRDTYASVVTGIVVVDVNESEGSVNVERFIDVDHRSLGILPKDRIEFHLNRRRVIVLIDDVNEDARRVGERIHFAVEDVRLQLIKFLRLEVQRARQRQNARLRVKVEQTVMIVGELVDQLAGRAEIGVVRVQLNERLGQRILRHADVVNRRSKSRWRIVHIAKKTMKNVSLHLPLLPDLDG